MEIIYVRMSYSSSVERIRKAYADEFGVSESEVQIVTNSAGGMSISILAEKPEVVTSNSESAFMPSNSESTGATHADWLGGGW